MGLSVSAKKRGFGDAVAIESDTKRADAVSAPRRAPKKQTAAGLFWKRQARVWHWMSGAICLIAMLGFAITGITLNHASQIPGQINTVETTLSLPAAQLRALEAGPEAEGSAPLPASVAAYLSDQLDIRLADQSGEWTDFDVYVSLPRAGGDAWISIDRETGEVAYESTDRGVIAFANDLHKGRNTGPIWSLFIDIFAGACVVFCLTGLWLLALHADKRNSTWPLVLGGLAVPAVVMIFFLHL